MMRLAVNFNLVILLFAFTAGLCSCELFNSSEAEKEPVARVQDVYLYVDEVRNSIPSKLNDADSITRADKYIRNWVERQLMVSRAEQNLKEEKQEIQKKLQEYRNDLLIYSYQTELVNQKLDTVVTEREIRDYYEEHKERFVLRDHILLVNYVKLDHNAPKINEAKKNLMSDSDADLAQLEDYCFQFASNFYLDQSSWVYLDDLLKEVPVTVSDATGFLQNRDLIELTDEDYIYLVRILEARNKGGQSPLSLEKEYIKDIILNKRKVEFLSKLKSDIFNEAERKNNFEIYR